MSVGHVSREFENAGIPTVVIAVESFETKLKKMAIPRLLLTHEVMGRPMGAPGERAGQTAVLEAALDLLENAEQNGTISRMPY